MDEMGVMAVRADARSVDVVAIVGSAGAAGAAAAKSAGGTVLAQDEATSEYFGMPGAAILAGGVDEVLPLGLIGPAVLEHMQSVV
jgi:two-component system chemotaxis response regulator CheB